MAVEREFLLTDDGLGLPAREVVALRGLDMGRSLTDDESASLRERGLLDDDGGMLPRWGVELAPILHPELITVVGVDGDSSRVFYRAGLAAIEETSDGEDTLLFPLMSFELGRRIAELGGLLDEDEPVPGTASVETFEIGERVEGVGVGWRSDGERYFVSGEEGEEAEVSKADLLGLVLGALSVERE